MYKLSTAANPAVLLLCLTVITNSHLLAQRATSPAGEIRQHLTNAQQALAGKQFALAEQELSAVLTAEPKNVEARANLGVVQFLQGKYPEATANLRQTLHLQPSLWKAQAILGLCEKAQRKPESAQKWLEKSFPHLNDPQLQMRSGMALVELDYQRRDFEKALAVLQTLRKLDPANADVLYVTYRIHADLATQARDDLAMAAPNSARMHQLLAEHLVNEGELKGAITQYREALRIDPRLPGVHFELAEAILQDSMSDQGQQEAQQEFEAALAANPADVKSQCRLGALATVRGDMDAALQHYTRAAELDPDESEAQIGLGRTPAATGQPDKALEHLLNAVHSDPLNARAHYRLSQVYRILGRASDAEQETAVFKKLKDAEDRLHAAYAQVYKESGSTKALNPDIPQ